MSFESRTPVKVIATDANMRKGYWKVIAVDAFDREVDALEVGLRSKRFAFEVAARENERGYYVTGISGARYEQKLGEPAHARYYRDEPQSELIKP